MPDLNNLAVNRYLTNVVQGYAPDAFICNRVAPPVPVLDESGQILKDQNGLVIYDTERALNAKAKSIDMSFSYDSYALTEHSLSITLDKKTIRKAEALGLAQLMNIKEKSAKTLTRMLLAAKEKALADIVFGTSYYTETTHRKALATTTCWDAYETSDPLGDIADAKSAVRNSTGSYPNSLVIGATGWEILKNHPDILGMFKNQMGPLSLQQVTDALELKQIIIGLNRYYNGSATVDFWGDSAALLPIPTSDELVDGFPSFVLNLELMTGAEIYGPVDEGEVERYIEMQNWQLKHISANNGYLITNLIA